MSIAQRVRLAAADPLLERLDLLEQRVRALEGRHRVRDERHAAALTALAAAVTFRAFTAVSALQHAHQADRELLAFVDQQFLDPAVAAVPNTTPASVTNGLTPITPSGTTSSAAIVDVDKLIGQFLTGNPAGGILLMTPSVASMLVSATKSQTLTITGGSYAGVPVVTSGSFGPRIVMLDPSQIL